MRYPIVIEPGDEKTAYGVIVPDLPGCFSAGDTLDEAFDRAREAITVDEGQDIPKPSAMEAIRKNPAFNGWIFGAVDVELSKISE